MLCPRSDCTPKTAKKKRTERGVVAGLSHSSQIVPRGRVVDAHAEPGDQLCTRDHPEGSVGEEETHRERIAQDPVSHRQ
jgi:hypothetical protein